MDGLYQAFLSVKRIPWMENELLSVPVLQGLALLHLPLFSWVIDKCCLLFVLYP